MSDPQPSLHSTAPVTSPEESEIKVFAAAPTQPVTPAGKSDRIEVAIFIPDPPTKTDSHSAELPEEYFQPTAEDVRRAQASLSQRNKSLNERTFSLSKDREADRAKAEKKKEEKWPNVSNLEVCARDQ
jgi:tether containing UBX domain for GLUT4